MLDTVLDLLSSDRDQAELDALLALIWNAQPLFDPAALLAENRYCLHAVIRKSVTDPQVIGYLRLRKPIRAAEKTPNHDLTEPPKASAAQSILDAQIELIWSENSLADLQALITWAKGHSLERGWNTLSWNGQCLGGLDMKPQAFGFEACGSIFCYEIKHGTRSERWTQVRALQKLAPMQIPMQTPMQIPMHIKEPVPFGSKTRQELQKQSQLLLQQSTREFCYYSRDLDPQILDQNEMLETIRALALKEKARIRFLLQDPHRAIQNGHRLIELSRRMSSAISFRMPLAEDLNYPSAFAINDQFGFLFRQFSDRFDSEGDFYDIAEHNRLQRYFDEVWERSAEVSEFRRLGL